MSFHCIRSGSAIRTWFKSMCTVFGKLKRKSGQAAKANTVHQDWTMKLFKFLESHLTIWTDTRQLGKVPWCRRRRRRQKMTMRCTQCTQLESTDLCSSQLISSRPQSPQGEQEQLAQGTEHHRQEG